MGIRAALLDEQGVYLRVDELVDATELTARHLPQIRVCDLAPGKYRWIPTDNQANEYGGAFWPLAWLSRLTPEQREKLEHI